MKQRWLISSLILSMVLSPLFSPRISAQSKNTYSCVNYKGKPTTVVNTPRGKIQLIVWESDYFRNSGWNPQKRCQEVTQRFQEFSDKGILKFVTTGKINKYPVICVGKKVQGGGYQCQADGLLITLQINDNPDKVLKDLFSNAAKIGGIPVTRGNTVVSIPQFIDNAPIIEENEVKTEENPPIPPVTPEFTPESSGKKGENPPFECSPPLCE